MVNINGRNLCEFCFADVPMNGKCSACSFESNCVKYPTALPEKTILNGRYGVGRVLGKGGFGVTYLCYDSKEQKKVAIKEYLPDSLTHRNTGETLVSTYTAESEEHFKAGAQKFYEEARIVARFNGNPNIISVYEFFYENNTTYFVMEYLEGIDLKNYIKNNGGKISEAQTLYIVNKVTEALMVVHSTDVLHRDISPDNIFLCSDGSVKLIDFGAARQVVGEASKSLSVILKQGFAPLEQYQKKGNQGPWTDIYALGATIYYALTGNVIDDAMSRIEDSSLDMSGVTPQLASIIEKMLSVDIQSRYQNVFDLKRDLSQLQITPEEIKIEVPTVSGPVNSEWNTDIRTEDIGFTPGSSQKKNNVQSDNQDKKQKNKIIKIAAIAAAALVALVVIIIIAIPKGNDVETDIPVDGILAEDYDGNGNIVLDVAPNTANTYVSGESVLSAADYHTAAVKKDGTVVAVGYNENGQCDVTGWSDIVAVSTGSQHTIGLRKDGTVVTAGSNEYGQRNVSDWKDIVAISTDVYHTLGLKGDGTVVAAGSNTCGKCEVGNWSGITAVAAGKWHSIGLKKDGTLVVVGDNDDGQCNVSGWTDIVDVSTDEYHTVGLKKNGKVLATGKNNDGQCDVSDWTDIVAVSAGYYHTVGLKKDGTVVATGNNDNGQCKVSGWTDIVAISAGSWHTVGLKKDGTVVVVGYNGNGQCDVYGWTGIGFSTTGTSVSIETTTQPVKRQYYPDDASNNIGNFFADLYNSDGTLKYTFFVDYLNGQKVYRIDASTGKKKHLDTVNANLLFAVNDEMLLFQNANDNGNLYSCDLDGNNQKLFYKGLAYNLASDGKWLYFKDTAKNDDVFRMDLKTLKTEMLFSDNALCSYYKDYIYYIDDINAYLCRRDADGKNKKVLVNKTVGMLTVVGESVYYYDEDYNLCVCDLEGRSSVILAVDCNQFTVHKGMIYYATQNGSVYSITTTGKNKTFVGTLPNYNNDVTALFFAGNDTVYFFYMYGDKSELYTFDIG